MYTPKSYNCLFQRRLDITPQDRITIAYLALNKSEWGTITALADEYKISRQFIYNLASQLSSYAENYFSKKEKIDKASKKASSEEMVAILRLEGKCSIESTSSVMKRLGLPYSSVGFISETLTKLGEKIGNNLGNRSGGTLIRLVICSDEIYSNQTPILITVCPISMMILRIELSEKRDGISWKEHWESIISQGFMPISITRDEGVGMKSGQEMLDLNIPSQSDTYHGVAHRLGLRRINLEKAAYNAIEQEYENLRVLGNTKSDEVFDKRYKKYIDSKEKSSRVIKLYDSFEFLYYCLLECFQIFDSSGKLKNETATIADFDTALDWIESLNDLQINEQIKSIRNCKKDLFYFTQIAKEITTELSQTIDNESLKLFYQAYQIQKNSIKLKNKPEQKKALQRKEQYKLNEVKQLLGASYEVTKKEVYAKLDQIVQSSAAVECINSILRPYLNTSKNKPSQEFLNTFMFYHNHRRFAAGKRKGKTPYEIFSGEPQVEDWLELLKKAVA